MNLTFTEVGIIITIMGNLGVFGLFKFFLARLVNNVDNKADSKTVSALENSIKDLKDLVKLNFDEDKNRDKKIDALITNVAVLVEQMRNVAANADPAKISKCENDIVRLETKVESIDKYVLNIGLKINNVEERIIVLEKKSK